MFNKKATSEKGDNQSSVNNPIESENPVNRIQGGEVAIHSMPEKFRFNHDGSSSAKNFGLLILVGGTLLIIISLFLLYFFVYKDGFGNTVNKNPTLNQTQNNLVQTPDNKKSEPIKEVEFATTTNGLGLGDDIDLATTTATTTEEQIEDQISPIARGAEDSDGDGLFDKEEVLLGTDINKTDSDDDGYSDFSELLNLYNPAGSGKLTANKGVLEYINNTFDYSLLYPSEWSFSKVGGDDSVILTSSDNQFIQIISLPNEDGLSLEEWYSEQQSLVSPVSSSRKIYTDTWQGIKSEDGLVVYITGIDRENIFAVAYSFGVGSALDYKNIFDMAVKSFSIKK